MTIKNLVKIGLVFTAIALAPALSLPVSAAGMTGQLRDTYFPSIKGVTPEAGPCYLRADVGYSLSNSPDAAGIRQSTFDDSWLAEVGGGCGSVSRGLRADLLFGFRGDRDFSGVAQSGFGPANTPLTTSLSSYTLMLNAYYDFGRIRGFVPYLGAGVGAAFHTVDDVSVAGGRAEGGDSTAFAWALMAGLGYQVSDRALLDLGYRYIDMGSADSGGSATSARRIELDGISAHEFKLGLRYHFGQSSRCCDYESLK